MRNALSALIGELLDFALPPSPPTPAYRPPLPPLPTGGRGGRGRGIGVRGKGIKELPRKPFWPIGVLAAIIFVQVGLVLAQGAGQVQEITGHLAPQEVDPFVIRGLREGQTLYAFMETTSGNLDPAVAVVSAPDSIRTAVRTRVVRIDLMTLPPWYRMSTTVGTAADRPHHIPGGVERTRGPARPSGPAIVVPVLFCYRAIIDAGQGGSAWQRTCTRARISGRSR